MGEARVNPERPSPSFEPPEVMTLNGSLGRTTDDYLTDEAVEKAAKALYEDGWEGAGRDARQYHREAAERALSAALPDIIRQAKAEALRDAADEAVLPDREQWARGVALQIVTTSVYTAPIIGQTLTATVEALLAIRDAASDRIEQAEADVCRRQQEARR
ncbi:hypothetical protein [Tessaracoccus massiliensis]|uniref:hypothetical protein n=1 Tax=Tessaracoccus massiliensis TaxID=1522311 RepID=UPI00058E3C98|nr:hypothetical protein [Tessaracoccus massiliensis]